MSTGVAKWARGPLSTLEADVDLLISRRGLPIEERLDARTKEAVAFEQALLAGNAPLQLGVGVWLAQVEIAWRSRVGPALGGLETLPATEIDADEPAVLRDESVSATPSRYGSRVHLDIGVAAGGEEALDAARTSDMRSGWFIFSGRISCSSAASSGWSGGSNWMLVIVMPSYFWYCAREGAGLSSREQEQRDRDEGEQAAHQLHDSVSRS